MRVFTYCSSRHHNSYTQQVIDLLLKELSERIEIELSEYSAKDLNIRQCIGCSSCFYRKPCPNDKIDGFDKIKKQMIDADIIILGSPVYACNVSGDMKIFIDRISSHLHLMSLCGKIGIPILTSSSNSLIETNEYFRKMFDYLGTFVPFSIMCTVDYPRQLSSHEFQKEKIPMYAENIVAYATNQKRIVANRVQEQYFIKMRKKYSVADDNNPEAKYWKEEGMLKYATYQELIDNIRLGED